MPLQTLESKKTAHRYFHAMCILPDSRFDTQHSDEQVLLVLRAHPVTFVPWIVTSVILFFLPFAGNFIINRFLTLNEVLFVNIFWYSAIFTYVFINILLWAFNVGIVTNHRIIDIDFKTVLHREFSGSSLDDIADVTARTTGFIRSLFRYGDVFVQTAGIEQNIEFLAVPEPNQVVALVSRIIRDHRARFHEEQT